MQVWQQKLETMRNGGRVVLSDKELDAMGEDAGAVRTARNKRCIGTIGVYVGWIHDKATPADLEYRDTPDGNRLGWASV